MIITMVAMLEDHLILKFMCVAIAKYTKTLQYLLLDALGRGRAKERKTVSLVIGNSHLFFFHHFVALKVLYLFLNSHLIIVLSLIAPYSIPTGEQRTQAEDLHYPGIYWHSMVKELQEPKEDHTGYSNQCIFSPQEDIQPT